MQDAKETPTLDLVVRDALQSGIDGVQHIEMRDVTDKVHVRQGSKDGRAIADGGVQLQLVVVAEAFESVKLLARHRMVNGCLQAYLLVGELPNCFFAPCCRKWRSQDGRSRVVAELI